MICERARGCVFAEEKRLACNADILLASDPRPPAEMICIRALEAVCENKKRNYRNAVNAYDNFVGSNSRKSQKLREIRQRRLMSTGLAYAWADLELAIATDTSQDDAPEIIQRVGDLTYEVTDNAQRFDYSVSQTAIRALRLNAYLPAFEKRLTSSPQTIESIRRTNTANAAVLAMYQPRGHQAHFPEVISGDIGEITEELLNNRTLSRNNFLYLSSQREDDRGSHTRENFSHDAYRLNRLTKTAIVQTKLSEESKSGYDESVTLVAVHPLLERGNGFPIKPALGNVSYHVDQSELAALEINPETISIPVDHTDEHFEVSLTAVTDLLIREHNSALAPLSSGEKALLDLLSLHAIIAK